MPKFKEMMDRFVTMTDGPTRDAKRDEWLKQVPFAVTTSRTVEVAVFTNAEYDALRKHHDIVEPQSDAKLGIGMTTLSNINYLFSRDARNHKETPPDPRERLIVAGEKDKDGVMIVRKIYKGLQQPDGTIVVKEMKDTVRHGHVFYNPDNSPDNNLMSDADKKKTPRRIRPNGGSINPSDLTELEDWRKAIEYPAVAETGPQQGYSTGGPYDPNPPRNNAPMGAGKRIR